MSILVGWLFFFYNHAATTEIYTLSLHDALPISLDPLEPAPARGDEPAGRAVAVGERGAAGVRDRKSTRLNSSHTVISYAVFCLKKKNSKLTRSNWSFQARR